MTPRTNTTTLCIKLLIIIIELQSVVICESDNSLLNLLSPCHIQYIGETSEGFNEVFHQQLALLTHTVIPINIHVTSKDISPQHRLTRDSSFHQLLRPPGNTRQHYTGGCEIRFFNIQSKPSFITPKLYESTYERLEQAAFLRNNAAYVVLYGESYEQITSSQIVHLIYTKLSKIPFTSKVFAMTSDNIKEGWIVNQVSGGVEDLECFKTLVFIPMNKTSSLSALQTLWLYTHQNLHEGELTGEAKIADFFLGDLSLSMNFTRIDAEDRSALTLGHVSWTQTSSQNGDLAKRFINPSKQRKLWLHYGYSVDYYSFVTFAGNPEDYWDWGMLCKPLDFYCWKWILFCIPSLSLAILIIFMAQDYIKNVHQSQSAHFIKLIKISFWAISLLLESPEGSITTKIQQSKSKFFWLWAWFISAIVLTHGYKGSIFSFMSRVNYPIVPKTLQGLNNSNLDIISTRASLKLTVFEDVIKYQPTTGNSLKRIYNDIRLVSTSLLPQLGKGNENNIWNKLGVPQSKMVTVFDEEERLKGWIAAMIFLTKSFVILSEDDLALKNLYCPHPWNAFGNFFVPALLPKLSSYSESGIMDWRSKTKAAGDIINIFQMFFSGRNLGCFSCFFALSTRKKVEYHSSTAGEPLRLDRFHTLVLLYFVIILTAGVVYLVEINLYNIRNGSCIFIKVTCRNKLFGKLCQACTFK
jgi:hypothetical protein